MLRSTSCCSFSSRPCFLAPAPVPPASPVSASCKPPDQDITLLFHCGSWSCSSCSCSSWSRVLLLLILLLQCLLLYLLFLPSPAPLAPAPLGSALAPLAPVPQGPSALAPAPTTPGPPPQDTKVSGTCRGVWYGWVWPSLWPA